MSPFICKQRKPVLGVETYNQMITLLGKAWVSTPSPSAGDGTQSNVGHKQRTALFPGWRLPVLQVLHTLTVPARSTLREAFRCSAKEGCTGAPGGIYYLGSPIYII